MSRHGRRNKKKRRQGGAEEGGLPLVSPEAIRGVSAVFLIALAGFLILANFHVGGAMGEFLYTWLSWLLGIGYMLFPLTLLLTAIAILRSFEKHFGIVQLGSVAVFLLSALGMVNLAFPGRGGVLGVAVSAPVVSAVDTPATVVFLLAFTIASLIVAFDVHLGALFTWIRDQFRKNPEVLVEGVVTEGMVVGLPEDESKTEEEPLNESVSPEARKGEVAKSTLGR